MTAAGGSTIIEVNTLGASGAEMAIELANGAAFGAANLVLTGNPNGDFGSDGILVGDGGDILAPVPAVDVIDGGGGEDYIYGGQLDDDLHGGADNDIVRGRAGNDILSGDEGHDVLDGGDGNDQLFGGDGIETMRGQPGNDQLDGGEGNDFLDGGTSVDRILGGGGDDTCSAGRAATRSPAATGGTTSLWKNAKEGRDTILDLRLGATVPDRGRAREFNGSEAALDRFVRFVPATGGQHPAGRRRRSGAAAWSDLALVQGVAGCRRRPCSGSGGRLIDDRMPIPGRVEAWPTSPATAI